jgi:hypothetical protein
MYKTGIDISQYLNDDGSETGLCEAQHGSQGCLAYRIPRAELQHCANHKDFSKLSIMPGVYFMFGQLDEKENGNNVKHEFVYIGESMTVLNRIRIPHDFETKKRIYWQDVIVLVSERFFNETRIKYLEKRFIEISKKADRCLIINANTLENSNNTPSERDLDALEKIIEEAKLFLFHLGHRVLEPLPSSTNIAEEDRLFLSTKTRKGEKIEAFGVMKEDGFWLLQGSSVCREVQNYLPQGYKNLREKYKGMVKKGKLIRDIRFDKPSAASSFVYGRNSNGWNLWKDKSGRKLKEIITR